MFLLHEFTRRFTKSVLDRMDKISGKMNKYHKAIGFLVYPEINLVHPVYLLRAASCDFVEKAKLRQRGFDVLKTFAHFRDRILAAILKFNIGGDVVFLGFQQL